MNITQPDLDRLFRSLDQTVKDWCASVGAVAPGAIAAPVVSGPAPVITHSISGPPAELAGAMQLTFEDTFQTLDWGRWDSVPLVNDPNGNGSSLPSNGERQWYLNHRTAVTAGFAPWRIEDGVLTITASPMPAQIRPFCGYSAAEFPSLQPKFALGTYDYISGRLATHRSFNQTYGYFECFAQLPAGRGLWPAFWMLRQDMEWPPEVDIFEVLGQEPDHIYQTVHWKEADQHKSDYKEYRRIDTSDSFHRYGVLWTQTEIRFYVDGSLTGVIPTPADMHDPMYLILNLAVTSDPDASKFPAQMRVRSVRAWGFR